MLSRKFGPLVQKKLVRMYLILMSVWGENTAKFFCGVRRGWRRVAFTFVCCFPVINLTLSRTIRNFVTVSASGFRERAKKKTKKTQTTMLT